MTDVDNKEILTQKIDGVWLHLYETLDRRDVKELVRLAMTLRTYYKRRDIKYE